MRAPQDFNEQLNTASWRREWETYNLISNSDGTYSFKTYHGGFIRGESGAMAVVNQAYSIRGWEKWNLIRQWGMGQNVYCIRNNAHGNYLRSDG